MDLALDLNITWFILIGVLLSGYAIIGIPFVLTYTISIYWIFRGKVKLESHSY